MPKISTDTDAFALARAVDAQSSRVVETGSSSCFNSDDQTGRAGGIVGDAYVQTDAALVWSVLLSV